MKRTSVGLVSTIALAVGIAIAACGESGVVGGNCRPGLVFCDGRCVDPNITEQHCGACGNRCAEGVACVEGRCGAGSDSGGTGGAVGAAGEAGASGALGVGGVDGVGGSGGVVGTAGSGGNTPGGTGGASGGDDGTGGGGASSCPEPVDVAERCGDCDTACSGATPYCAPDGSGSYECVSACEAPLARCGDQCVDLQTDPRHCGRCNNVCASGLCIDGVCSGVTAGHIVYACMNYEQVFAQAAQVTLLGNAVYLLQREPSRVLAYSQHAPSAVMNATDRAILWAGDRIGRTADVVRESDVSVIEDSLEFGSYEVFLVYDQSSASEGELASVGAQLSSVLADFTLAGGVVVVLSGATGIGEMGEFATSAGLVDVGVESDWTGELVYNQAAGDAIGLGVITPFATLRTSCTFETTETPSANTVFVVTDTAPASGLGQPVVIHKIVTP